MSILSWFKEVTSGNASAELMQQSLEFKDGEQDFHGLNMRDALDAHTAWTKRLEGKIEGSNNEELDIAKVASDCECVLGKWIHGEAKKQFGEESDLEELRKVHADFHLKAGEILNNVTNGDHEDARENLKKLRHQSGSVQLSLVRLYSHSQH